MINYQQHVRMIAKVSALAEYYAAFEAVSRTLVENVSFYQKRDGEETPEARPIRPGETWGGDFVYGTFCFTLHENSILEIDNGALENTVYANGAAVGLTDTVPGARMANERLHRYISVPAGTVTVEGYAGHTYCGSMPREGKQTFFFNGYSPDRTYNGIFKVCFDEALRRFDFLLSRLNDWYAAGSATMQKEAGAVYQALFDTMPLSMRPAPSEIAAGTAILERFFDCFEAGAGPAVGAVGHSHLDTAWLWPIEETVRKAVRTASNAVRLLRKYPKYRFVMSTMLYYDWFKKDFPDLYRTLRALVEEGRFEPTAGWVECDCNLTGAEALCRQFLRGARFQQAEFGKTARVFWLPDTFGYSAALPQIMRLSGVEYFCTTKLSWNDTNRFPYDTFIWAGLDGTTVKTHFNTTHTRLSPQAVTAKLDSLAGRHVSDAALIAYGFGDGGAGPSEEMVEEALLTERYPQARVEHTSVEAFMRALPDELPVWHDELYLELHRGTLTSRHDLKRLDRTLENALQAAEFVGVLKGRGKETTDALYDTLLLNQFHDILPGTAIARVNDRAEAELTGALEETRKFIEEMSGRGDVPLNTLSMPAEGYVPACGVPGVATYLGPDGLQRAYKRVKLPPFASGTMTPQGLAPKLVGNTVTTPYYTAVLNDDGIASLAYRGRELSAGTLGVMTVGEDLPLQWDSWDIDADQARKRKSLPLIGRTHFTAGGLLAVRDKYRVSDRTVLVRDMLFNNDDAIIRFDTAVDWKDDHTLLTVEFETSLFTPRVKCEVQFGFVERSVYDSTSVEQAQFEYVNHRWSELVEDTLAFSLLNDGKYGVHCSGGTLGLSLIKSGTHPDERGERGVKTFSYAIYPHAADTTETVRAAALFNRPPIFADRAYRAPFDVKSDSVVCETVKTAECGGIALRLYECARRHAKCELTFPAVQQFFESDIPELNMTPLGEGTSLSLDFRPFEIKTIVARPKP